MALVDQNSAAIAATKQAFPPLAGAAEFADHQAMLEAVGPDAVEIATPHVFHFPQILDAFGAGCHVLTEKPLACTARDAEQVLAERDAAGKILLVSYQRHYSPIYRYVKDAIAAGRIGELQFVTGLQSHGWYREHRGRWRQDPEVSGGGQLIDWGSHLLDVVMYATYRAIVPVTAYEQRFDLRVEVNMAISVRFEGGAIGNLTQIGNATTPSWEDLGFYGSRGTLLVRSGKTRDAANPELIHFDAEQSPVDTSVLPEGSNPDQNFVDAIRGRDKVHSTGEDGLRVLRVTEACMQAAKNGQEVRVA